MNQRLLMEKIGRETTYLYSEFEDVVLRTCMVDGELEVYIKHREGREFKAVFDSRLVGLALSCRPQVITREQYEKF